MRQSFPVKKNLDIFDSRMKLLLLHLLFVFFTENTTGIIIQYNWYWISEVSVFKRFIIRKQNEYFSKN